MEKNTLISRIIKTESIRWRDLQFIQQDDFKEWVNNGDQKLQASILRYQFIDPFKVWLHDGVMYCLDGRHRYMDLLAIAELGNDVPELLPATFIDCCDKTEAAELVLIYSSRYAKITNQGLFDFIQIYDLEYDSIKNQMDIPDFSYERFEQKFDLIIAGESDDDIIVTEDDIILVQLGDIFEINGHRIACGTFKDDVLVSELMGGKLARILNCDPPYNLHADFFITENQKSRQHEDFKMGSGEMSDGEFITFLSELMKISIKHTVDGSIHYIFMDWRHMWHICEAAKTVYGSPVPKQLCVWNKSNMANGSFYRSKHEFIFIFKSGKAKHLSHIELKDRIRTNVWEYLSTQNPGSEERDQTKAHPTPKPVKLIADSILDTTNEKDIVIDWFLGSGTCVIASEQTGRFCYGTEIEPRFVQHILRRYLTYCKKNGIPIEFAHINGNLTINHFTLE